MDGWRPRGPRRSQSPLLLIQNTCYLHQMMMTVFLPLGGCTWSCVFVAQSFRQISIKWRSTGSYDCGLGVMVGKRSDYLKEVVSSIRTRECDLWKVAQGTTLQSPAKYFFFFWKILSFSEQFPRTTLFPSVTARLGVSLFPVFMLREWLLAVTLYLQGWFTCRLTKLAAKWNFCFDWCANRFLL